jgi:signal transduction histidine kinase
MVAGWLVVLTVVFNLVLARWLTADADAVLRDRAAAAAATVTVDRQHRLRIQESGGDEALDSGIWFYAGQRSVERPTGGGNVQAVADALAGRGPAYGTGAGNRLFALPITHAGSRAGTVVTALSLAPYRHTRKAALYGSIIIAALTLIGTYLALRLVAARALRPVGAMTDQAAAWSTSALSKRFGPEQRFDELRQLSATLNGLLDRLTASVRHEQRLSAELSHELRTPLSLIVAETDLLLARDHDPARVRAAHEQIHRTALAMNRILETLLSAGRAQIANATGTCRVAAAVADVLAHAESRATRVIEIPDDLSAGVEAALLERVLAPLADNAARFASTTLRITGRRTTDSVLITVTDDGPGVPPEHAEAIFQPGTQLGGGDGAGLGLPLARRLARAAGGDVSFLGGATFQARIPPA